MTEVLVETQGKTRIVTLNRPQARNALTRGVLRTAAEAISHAGEDKAVRCVVLAAAGGHFCAGADLRKNLEEDANLLDNLEHYMDDFHGLIRAVVRSPKPVIGEIEGAAVGFGADLALSCDLRVASTTAYVQEKFVNIGLMPDGGGTFWLPRLVGTARAMQMILLAEKVDAPKMSELGLVVKVVPPSELRAATMSIARELEKGPPLAFAAAKAAVYASWGDVEAALRREREGQLKLLRTSDFMEGVAAWTQKREPSYTGS